MLQPRIEVGRGPAAPPGSVGGSQAMAKRQLLPLLLPVSGRTVHAGAVSHLHSPKKNSTRKKVSWAPWPSLAPELLKARDGHQESKC